ncbi:MAG: pyridoxal-phosphate dependent enzyme, partial [Bosea sp.]|nr:pyridoxal-phosphate dependent enzyme [Bosea sp. (in: a-proteobacteria)]
MPGSAMRCCAAIWLGPAQPPKEGVHHDGFRICDMVARAPFGNDRPGLASGRRGRGRRGRMGSYGYCERTDPSFWAEPLNAWSNGAFLLAALAGLILLWRVRRADWPVAILIALVFAIAIGSFLFHTMPRRWTLLAEAATRYGWFIASPYHAPVVGSHALGIEGYKTIAYEIVEESGGVAPDWCVLPVCYGDAFFGVWSGFQELFAQGAIPRLPRMAAAEVHGSLAQALATGRDRLEERSLAFESLAVLAHARF